MNIFDNALPEDMFQELYNIITDVDTSWHYSSTAYADEDDSLYNFSFCHMIFMDNTFKSKAAKVAWPAIKQLVEKAGDEIDELLRIRVGLTMVTNEPFQYQAHVDFPFPHKTGLIYLNKCNAPTALFHEKFYPEDGKSIKDYCSEYTLKDQVFPDRNKAVIFDGLTYHTTQSPTDVARRLVVNFNYIPKTR